MKDKRAPEQTLMLNRYGRPNEQEKTRRPGRRFLFAVTVEKTAQAFLRPFAWHLRASGHSVTLLCNADSVASRNAAFDRLHYVPWHRNPVHPGNVVALIKVLRLLGLSHYDIVHTHTPIAALVTRLAIAMLRPNRRPKVVYTAHGLHFRENGNGIVNGLFLAAEKAAGRWTDVLIVINREDEAVARRHRLMSPERIRCFPGIGIDTEKYRPERVDPEDVATLRASMGLTPEDDLFVMVAEFNPGKRHLDAVEALSRMERPSAHLAFAGEGRLMERVRAKVSRLGLERRVHFLGFRRDVPVLMRAATATLMPSEREGLNRSVMESLALEVPVIGSDARGVKDLLADGCGVVVPVGDVGKLARAMAWVRNHPEEARGMARKGRERVVTEHDIRHILKLHDQVYAELLGDK